ncbi:MAG: MinD/ParA family protein [Bacillota bacterium]|nr:MinD/ParA family protein [Bacillota bacterium]
MKDQANKLREMAEALRNQIEAELSKKLQQTRVIVVSSGKGGVGKSTVALNTALDLCALGKRVVLMDADLGMANIDIMLGIIPQYNIYDMITEQKTIKDIMVDGPNGLKIIPGGSGMIELANIKDNEMKKILVEMGRLDGEFDYLIVDTGAGIANNVLSFLLAADDIIVVTTPEPTSLTDAYGIVKNAKKSGFEGNLFLVVNRVAKESEGVAVAQKFKLVSEKFLNLDIKTLGYILQDSQVEQGIRRQEALVQAFPRSPAARNLMNIARKLIDHQEMQYKDLQTKNGGIKTFFKKIIGYSQAE